MTVVALAEIADQVRGVSYGKADVVDRPAEGFLPVLRANNITDHGLSFDNLVYVRAEKVSAKQQVRSGDIVIAASSGSLSVVGKAAQAEDDLGMGFGAFCKVVRPSPKVNARYIGHFFKTQDYRRRMSALAAGANINNLKNEHIDEIEIPLPPLSEQKRIAAILDQADELRRKRQRSIDRLNQLGQAIFYEMFGDPVTNPMGFAIRNLREFYISEKDGTKCGPFGSALKKEEIVESGIPVWNMDNIGLDGNMLLPHRMWITERKFRELESYSIIDGDIIISRAGTVGKMCVARVGSKKSIISTNLIRVRFGSNLMPTFFVSLMTHCKGKIGRLKTGPDGSFTHMNTGVLDNLQFPYPPIELQQRFGIIANEIDKKKMIFNGHFSHLDSLFKALQHRAFQGEL